MFKDKEEALRRLEAELLREEEEPEQNWEDDGQEEQEEAPGAWEQEEAQSVPDLRAYNADRVDEDLEAFGREVYDADRKIRGRWTAAGALAVLAALLLVLAFLAARYMGR